MKELHWRKSFYLLQMIGGWQRRIVVQGNSMKDLSNQFQRKKSDVKPRLYSDEVIFSTLLPGLNTLKPHIRDIHNGLPEVKGFSEWNIGYMVRFFREHGEPPILQQAVAKLPGSITKDEILFQSAEKTAPKDNHLNLQQCVAKIPWGHNILLMEKVKGIYKGESRRKSWSN